MNPTVQTVSPFAMLIDPEAVLAAVHGSERLSRIQGRICRPLDRPAPEPAAPAVINDVELRTEHDDLPGTPI